MHFSSDVNFLQVKEISFNWNGLSLHKKYIINLDFDQMNSFTVELSWLST